MDVEFRDLTFKIHKKWYKRDSVDRTILKSVSGKFRAGELSAILGPSGAGKSSLLNAISGFTSKGISGSLLVNGQQRDEKLFRKLSCYITQEDMIQPMLTLQEVMMFAAELKLSGETTLKHKLQLVHEIQSMLGLRECRRTRTEYLSGGQKKRLVVALELINNPPVIFLDEPTSGLDNVSTSQTLKLLRLLAHQGRTIVCTIHQPSASLFQLFDHVYVLAQGLCVYQGATTELVPFLASAGLHCPTHYNPADFVIEMTDGEEEDHITILAAATNNGKLSCFAKSKPDIPDLDSSIALPLPVPPIHTQLPNWKPPSPAQSETSFSSTDSNCINNNNNNNNNNNKLVNGILATSILSYRKISEKHAESEMHSSWCVDFPTSSWSQFCTIWKRMMLQTFRNKVGLKIQFYHHLMCGLAVGIVFWNKANDGAEFFNHMKFCMGVILFHTFTQCMVPVLAFPFEVKLLKREYFNRWYSFKPYYFALSMARIPTIIMFSMIFLSLVYFMSGLPVEMYRFFFFALIGIEVSLVAEGMGLFIGSVFNVTNGSAVGPLTIAPFLGLAIYGFDFAKEIHWAMNAVMKLSFLRCGVVGLVIVVFGMGRQPLQCDREMYCHFRNPRTMIYYLDLENTSPWEQVFYLTMMLCIFRILVYVGLKQRLDT
ncbi:unnamed protein product [Bemisia tabaci]|uniref:ABC transporter domain-containing protein n=1 Tax=Bemisia tabaci TaxID=7038 RepID=A0A9N9ZZC4_BEMTA|nr:unnamed protein product [Bemisia tabaci]